LATFATVVCFIFLPPFSYQRSILFCLNTGSRFDRGAISDIHQKPWRLSLLFSYLFVTHLFADNFPTSALRHDDKLEAYPTPKVLATFATLILLIFLPPIFLPTVSLRQISDTMTGWKPIPHLLRAEMSL
ncbi:hypothetical protein, partial [Novipirellula maiorica]|uniref:hypothetical protein n=1 Tax=Novipirellula maiorica TaxID=1265734 RepID=UPI001F1926B2